MASTSIHSTPIKQGMATRNSARIHGKTADYVIEDIEIDVANAQKAEFTSFLCQFLSRCLDGEKKIEFERLQDDIEQLQRMRLDQANLRQTPRGEDREQGTVHKLAEPGSEEHELVQRRDALLRRVLQECLRSTVDIANNGEIREKLKNFADLVKAKSPETARYHSYANMYNSALDELAKAQIPCLRAEDSLGLRLCHADPKDVVSIFTESKEKTECKPDFVRTSKAAALDIYKDGDFGAPPSTAFQWHQVLSCEEMKTASLGLTADAQAVLHNDYRFTGEHPLEKPGLEWIEPITPADMLNSQSNTPSQSQSQSQSKQFHSESSANVQSDTKRARTSGTAKKTPGDGNAKRNIGAHAQVARYAREMMSYSPGVVHVINTLIVDDRFYILYYDRQGCICSPGISIIIDFPLFLVLLLTFQRFTVDDWGVVPFLNPQILDSPKIDGLANRNTETVELLQNPDGFRPCMDGGSGPMLMSLKDYLSSQPHCLSGQMTLVLKGTLASNKKEVVMCKLCSPEVQRIREDHVLHVAHKTAEMHGLEMLDHLPTLHLSGDFDAGYTLHVRSVLGISCSGHCTLRVVVMKKLVALTALPDAGSIMKAWFDIIAAHALLWTHGIEHGDPSLWNMMADLDNKCGVLTDYDMSVLVWLKRVPDTDRTRTIPFMALELLHDNYWMGKLKRYYHHELEAILWAFIAVSIAFNEGKFKPWDTAIRSWFTSNHNKCRQGKHYFATFLDEIPNSVCPDFSHYEWFISDLAHLIEVQLVHLRHQGACAKKAGASMISHASQTEHSAHTWSAFITLISNSDHEIPVSFIDLLQKWTPTFDFAEDPGLVDKMHCLTDNLFSKNVGIYE